MSLNVNLKERRVPFGARFLYVIGDIRKNNKDTVDKSLLLVYDMNHKR